MGFIEREIERINTELRNEQDVPNFDQLYAAQQALSWAIEPTGFKAPYDMVMGIPGGSDSTVFPDR